MKEINKTTLEAIQSNVKTKETQELDYNRDNLFKGTWKDFEIADLQPNLIPDGWDGFSPYGSGENYVENWDFSNDDLSGWGGGYGDFEIINGVLTKVFNSNHQTSRVEYVAYDIPEGDYIFRIKIRSDVTLSARRWINVGYTNDEIPTSDNFIVWEQKISIKSENITRFRFYGVDATLDKKVEIDWIQITPIDNQHLVVEKTPLGNGLTRIQTWGGKSFVKLSRNYIDLDNIGKKRTISMYVDNLGDWFELRGHDRSTASLNIDKGYIGFGKHTYTLNENVKGHSYVMTNAKNNLDFIASKPQIVEGDKHNPVLVVDQLDDGTEHVQVYGAYPDTKLVYKGGEDFIGEEYVLKTDIENKGIGLNVQTPLSDNPTYISKGENQVEIKGELKEKLSVEVGIPNE